MVTWRWGQREKSSKSASILAFFRGSGMARKVPTDQLPKGAYRLEVQVTDSAGKSAPWRKADFEVE